MVGSKNRHDVMRRKLFNDQHKPLLELEHAQSLDAPPVNPYGPPENPDNNIFSEDTILYGERTPRTRDVSIMPTWPTMKPKVVRQTSKTAVGDIEWDIEHGDKINPLAFTKARLSQIQPKDTDRELIDGKNLLVETTDISTLEKDIPRALLLRCWERAVHAASCTTFAPKRKEILQHASLEENSSEQEDASHPILDADGNLKAGSSQKALSTYELEHEETCSSRDAIEEKCKSLKLDLSTRILLSGKCPRCSIPFVDHDKLKTHYYGGSGGQTAVRGCCWELIRQKHLYLIDTALQNHVKKQTELVLGTIMKEAKNKLPEKTSAETLRLMNWHDILKFMETTLESSKSVEQSQESTLHPCLETIQTKSEESPMVFNPVILEAVKRRLIDRYADVPL